MGTLSFNLRHNLFFYTWGRSIIKLYAFASFVACIMSSMVTPGRPKRMFSAMVVAKSTGSCSTMPISDRSHWMFRVEMSWPSKVT